MHLFFVIVLHYIIGAAMAHQPAFGWTRWWQARGRFHRWKARVRHLIWMFLTQSHQMFLTIILILATSVGGNAQRQWVDSSSIRKDCYLRLMLPQVWHVEMLGIVGSDCNPFYVCVKFVIHWSIIEFRNTCRLDRMSVTTAMIMEALVGFEHKYDYSIMMHSGAGSMTSASICRIIRDLMDL